MILALIRIWAALVLALHIGAYVLPETTAWSVWPYTFFPPWLGVSLAALVGLLTVPKINLRIQNLIRRVWAVVPNKERHNLWFALLAAVTIPIFWLFRIRHLGWGDAALLVTGLSFREAPVIYNWQAPFTVFLHQRLWTFIFNPLLGWGVDTVYAIVSVLTGGAFVFVSLQLTRSLGKNTLQRALLAGLILTTGTMQLFFGYVENYTLVSLGIIIFLWFGHKVLRNEASLWPAALALSVTNALHPSTLVLWPAAFYLAWHQFQQKRSFIHTLLELALPPLIIAAAVLTMMELGDHGLEAFLGDDRPGGGDHIWFVPLTLENPTEWLRYSMFSPAHLLDWSNEMMLTSVYGVFIILLGVGALIANSGKQIPHLWQEGVTRSGCFTRGASQLWFFATASLTYLWMTWVWNADYGIRKDWDLFSPSAIVYSIFAGLILFRLLKNKQDLAQAALIIIAVSGLHTAGWILMNTQPLF